ncbi:MAG: hypothetical protein A2527_14105 [Candidatus Lambdaproteobacteria bacterium RIFOXYD2_FULL_50_16]|uniref:Uncharacterized protein n=1 Tax=Candidatus Lambdaproteobacteria bacterium RIFOXYD2_FULL_50_16 TaxID=1817772 RepID=A0A1F6G4M3_9PROT|nr:MAG: hypothetical protein A2527_14105 [Candidatus Lambdaproteobacteria bacterium RIFOXYD2_FULL_50_16]
MAASGNGALQRYKDATGLDPTPELAQLVQAIFDELKANGSFSFASGQVTGTTATQIGAQALTSGAATGGKFDG